MTFAGLLGALGVVLSALHGLKLIYGLLIGGAIALGFLSFIALKYGNPPPGHRKLWYVGLIAGVLAGVSFGHPADNNKGQSAANPSHRSVVTVTPQPTPRPQSRLSLGPASKLGLSPVSMTVIPGYGLCVAGSEGVVRLDPATDMAGSEVGVVGSAAAVAAAPAGKTVVLGVATERRLTNGTHQAWVTTIDTGPWTAFRPAFAYSNQASFVVGTRGVLWFADGDSSKVDRLDLRTGGTLPVGVDDSPTGLLAAGGSVWVAIGKGLVTRVASDGTVIKKIATSAGPGPMAFDPDRKTLWVAHHDTRLISRIDTTRNVEVGPSIHDRRLGDVKALAFANGSLWVAGGDTDEVRQIDPQKGKIIASVAVTAASALAVYDGELYVASRADGTLRRIIVSPPPPTPPVPGLQFVG